MTTAYIATTGSYSDFTIVRVFLDKELADQFLADGFCEEIAEHKVAEKRIVPGQLLHLQWTSPYETSSGTVPADDWQRVERVEADGQPACDHQVFRRDATWHRGEHVVVVVRGLDHERVRKTYSEQVAMTRVELGELDPTGAE